MAKDTILIVDDEKNIRSLLRMYLQQDGFAVEEAVDGPSTLKILEKGPFPALIILDVMLPGIDGFQLLSRLRSSEHAGIPVLMLTARDDDIDKIVGLEIGADDYVTKPFNPREVVARVKAIIRRTQNTTTQQEPDVIVIGDLSIDHKRRTVTVNGKDVAFRRKEFDVLYLLAKEYDIVHTREQLLDAVWGYDYYGQTRTVDVHIAAIRSKLKSDQVEIETVTGIGYRLTKTESV